MIFLWLDLDDARKILQQHDFPLPRAIMLGENFLDRLTQYQCQVEKEIGFPCVIKAVSPEILHKTDVGAVHLNVKTFDELVTTVKAMQKSLGKTYRLKGFLVEEQVDNIQVEVVIGVKHNHSFGHVIMVGLGGIHVEILEDVSFRLIPITEEDAREMLEELRARKLFDEFRGRASINKDALVSLMVKVSDLVAMNPQIIELDLNPVGCNEKGCFVLDVRIKINNDSIS